MIVNRIIRYVLILSLMAVTPFNLIASSPANDQDEQIAKHLQAVARIFENVVFIPEPESIQHSYLLNPNGDAIFHFRDTAHLKRVFAAVGHVDCSNLSYFLDKDARDQQEFELLSAVKRLDIGNCFEMTSPQPLKLTGKLFESNIIVFVPPKSNLSGLEICGNHAKVTNDIRPTRENALYLADFLDQDGSQKNSNKIDEVAALFKQRRDSRQSQPELYPDFNQLSDCYLVSRSEININQTDYLTTLGYLIYAAPTASQLTELKSQYPDFNRAICLIDPRINTPSIYSDRELEITKGFNITAASDLTLMKDIVAPNHFINFDVQGKFRGLNGVVRALHINFNTQETTFKKMTNIIKPDGMANVEWERVVDFLVEKGHTSRANPN